MLIIILYTIWVLWKDSINDYEDETLMDIVNTPLQYSTTLLDCKKIFYNHIDQIATLEAKSLGDIICWLASLICKYQQVNGDSNTEEIILNMLESLLVCIIESNRFVQSRRIGLNALFKYYYHSGDGVPFSIRLIRSGATMFFINKLHSYGLHFNLYVCKKIADDTTIADNIIQFNGDISTLRNFMKCIIIQKLEPYLLGCVILSLASLLFKYPESAIIEILELLLCQYEQEDINKVYKYYYGYVNTSCNNSKAHNTFTLQLIYNGASEKFVHTMHLHGFDFNTNHSPQESIRSPFRMSSNNLLYCLIYSHKTGSVHDYFYFIKYSIDHNISIVSKRSLITAVSFSTLEIFQYLLDKYLDLGEVILTDVLSNILIKDDTSDCSIMEVANFLIKKGANIYNIHTYSEMWSNLADARFVKLKRLHNRLGLLTYHMAFKEKGIHILDFSNSIQWLFQKLKKDNTLICRFI